MKLKIHQQLDLTEERVEIYCREKTEKINNIVNYISETNTFTIIGYINTKRQVWYKSQILYFESVDKKCYACTDNNVYHH